MGAWSRCLAGRWGEVLKVGVGFVIQLSLLAVLLHGAHDRVFPVDADCIYLFPPRGVLLRGCSSSETKEKQREKQAVVFIVVCIALTARAAQKRKEEEEGLRIFAFVCAFININRRDSSVGGAGSDDGDGNDATDERREGKEGLAKGVLFYGFCRRAGGGWEGRNRLTFECLLTSSTCPYRRRGHCA